MSTSSKNKKYVTIILLLVAPILFLIYLSKGEHKFTFLPIYGQKYVDYKTVNGEEIADTIYHTIPDFTLLDQDSNLEQLSDFEYKIIVADFFFTSCPSICPKMTQQMKRIYEHFADEDRLMFLSHSIDTRRDSVPVLKAYADRLNIDHVEQILEMADRLGAEYLELANTQYYGWAWKNREALLPSREQVRRAEEATQRFRERVGNRGDAGGVCRRHCLGRSQGAAL